MLFDSNLREMYRLVNTASLSLYLAMIKSEDLRLLYLHYCAKPVALL